MERYEKYKPSGIEWIGEVPEHWEVCKLKHLCEIYGRIGYRGYTEADLVTENEGAITLSPSNFSNGKLDYSKCSYLTWEKYYESPEIMINNGDVIFVKTASVGKCAIVTDLPKEATLNPQIVVFKKLKCNGAFLNYYCQTPIIQSQVATSLNGSTISTISQEKIGAYVLVMPPLHEQEAIAVYLDARCADIDKVVATQEKRIALLKELKQSVITQAVTRGLNPDVKMKDSGVEWIGEVPEHWSVLHLKHVLLDYQDGTHGSFNRVESEYPLLSAKNVWEDGIRISEDESTISKEDYESIVSNGFPNKDDIVLCCVGTIGRCCIYDIDKPYAFQRSVTFLRVNDSISNRYLLYQLRSQLAKQQFDINAKTSAQSGIYMDTLVNFNIVLPSIEEQTTIATYLDDCCGKIDKQIEIVTKQIGLLREYKQSLITEVVTGKRKIVN